ncbi:hypothetical protein WJX84_010745 [Apatococcus fuscideae]|uniref:Protein transport protein Sec24-like n=1 Tax=Apatococcus fuscideae TaxID=2026836 RepID=A0AAW1SMZ6_9CHLO
MSSGRPSFPFQPPGPPRPQSSLGQPQQQTQSQPVGGFGRGGGLANGLAGPGNAAPAGPGQLPGSIPRPPLLGQPLGGGRGLPARPGGLPGGLPRPGMPLPAGPQRPLAPGQAAPPGAPQPAVGGFRPPAAFAGARPPFANGPAAAGPPSGPPTANGTPGVMPPSRPSLPGGPRPPGPPGSGLPGSSFQQSQPGIPPGFAQPGLSRPPGGAGPPFAQPGPPRGPPGPPTAFGGPAQMPPRGPPTGPPGFQHSGPPAFSGAPGPPGFQSGTAPSFSGASGAPGFSQASQQQRVLDQFESLTLGPGAPAAPGQPASGGLDITTLPRPLPPAYDCNCPPRFLRLSVNAAPSSQTLRQRFQLPLGAVVQPLGDPQDVPVVQPPGNGGIVRCKRCRTYMNPYMHWSDGGRRFTCNICGQANECPSEYFCALDMEGQRQDRLDRPELSSGSVEFIAPAEYMVRAPMPPTYFFVIDVSAPAMTARSVEAIVGAVREVLDQLPGGERTRIGFLTFDAHLQFWCLKSGSTQPQMMVVSDLDEPFVPQPDDLLVNLRDSRPAVDALLDSLPATFANNPTFESALGPALQAAFLVMSGIGGKLMLFQTSMPSSGVGKVKARDNQQAYGTDNEPRLRNADDPFYKKFAAECSRYQIAVDIFSFSQGYTDLASLGQLPKYTCGQLYYYPAYSHERDAEKLRRELCHNLTRTTGWEAVMRIRCSRGLKISNFHGHFFIRSTDLLALPQVDPDKAFAVQMAHEESVLSTSQAYMQCALLYTSSQGERRIRVHTLAMPVVQELADLYKSVDCAATITLLAKLAIEKSYSAKLEETRNAIQHKVSLALKEYRLMHGPSARPALHHSQFIFPESLRFLPILSLGLLKCPALKGGAKDVITDERFAVGLDVMAASTPALLRLIYPPLYPVHDLTGTWGQGATAELPLPIPLTAQALDSAGAYILDTGRVCVLWLGRSLDPEFMSQVFGIDPHTPQRPDQVAGLSVEPARGNEVSQRINNVVAQLRRDRPTRPALYVIRQGTPIEASFAGYLVEDKGHGALAYSEYLQMLHRGTMAKA